MRKARSHSQWIQVACFPSVPLSQEKILGKKVQLSKVRCSHPQAARGLLRPEGGLHSCTGKWYVAGVCAHRERWSPWGQQGRHVALYSPLSRTAPRTTEAKLHPQWATEGLNALQTRHAWQPFSQLTLFANVGCFVCLRQQSVSHSVWFSVA